MVTTYSIKAITTNNEAIDIENVYKNMIEYEIKWLIKTKEIKKIEIRRQI